MHVDTPCGRAETTNIFKVERYILILKKLNVKHETFPELFSSLDQDKNITEIPVKMMSIHI